jgi:DsbC/DsbD-like thiol-disulfide interchange protein
MQVDRSGLRAGESFELLVRLRIAGEHHINPLNEAEKPFIPTTLKLTLPEGIESVGDWTAPEPGKARSGAKIYTDSVLFRRRLKILENAKQGTLSLKGELEYQACTSELCWPPKTISLLTTIVVKQD